MMKGRCMWCAVRRTSYVRVYFRSPTPSRRTYSTNSSEKIPDWMSEATKSAKKFDFNFSGRNSAQRPQQNQRPLQSERGNQQRTQRMDQRASPRSNNDAGFGAGSGWFGDDRDGKRNSNASKPVDFRTRSPLSAQPLSKFFGSEPSTSFAPNIKERATQPQRKTLQEGGKPTGSPAPFAAESNELDMSHEDNDFDEFEDNRTWRSRRRRDRNIEEEEEEEEDHERERIPIELRRKRGNDEEEGERKGKWSPKMKQMMAEKKKASERPKMVPRQKEVEISEGTSIASLSNLLGISYDTLRRKMRKLGFENTDPDFVLNSEMASLIVMEYDFKPIITSSFEEIELKARDPPESWDNYPLRPPVVTIMGHVDHGKTTLLDSLRKTSVAASEAGGITQHIGAFSVKLAGGHQITFMDTPGHAAFSAMRQRGANTTDIVVLVVAADDGVMPQTVEAIKHAKAANVPIIVAINKCDKPQANVRKTMEGLLAHDILLEEYGGEIPSVPVSGLTGKGLDKLEETILALSEFLDIRGDPTGAAEGVVIESELDRRLGNAATVLVRRGTLKTGSVVVSGTAYARVRVLADDRGEHIDEAGPSVPVRMYGWKTLPQAGDEVIEVITEDESDPLPLARKIAESREEKAKSAARGVSIDELNDQRTRRKSGEEEVAGPDSERELRLIVKADVHGSLEALLDSIAGLPRHEVQANIVASGVGPPTESDIDMASATKSRIIAFNVATPKKMISHAAAQAVPLHEHNIIYRMIDHLKELLGDLLPPEKVAEVRGEAEIKQLFDVKGKGKVVNKAAGCFVRTGKIFMNKSVRVIREGGTVFEGQLKSLRFVKKEIPEAVKGQDCGILFVGFDDMREGDLVQSVEVVEYKRKFE